MMSGPGGIEGFMEIVEGLQPELKAMNEKWQQWGLDSWISGTYGLGRGVVCTTADKIIYKTDPDLNFLFVDRGKPCQWGQGGIPMVTFGGFAGPMISKDENILDTANREVSEEIGSISVEIEPQPLIITGHWKWSYYWDAEKLCAVKTGVLAQEIPICTINFLAKYLGGELKESSKALNPRWISLKELKKTSILLAFDHALVLEAAIKKLSRF